VLQRIASVLPCTDNWFVAQSMLCHGVSQSVAVRCNVLQCIALNFRVLTCANDWLVAQFTLYHDVLQCVEVHCSVLQFIEVYSGVLPCANDWFVAQFTLYMLFVVLHVES